MTSSSGSAPRTNREDAREATQPFCHLSLIGDSVETLCGADARDAQAHGIPYDGQAICNECGLVHCPTCVQLDSLEARCR